MLIKYWWHHLVWSSPSSPSLMLVTSGRENMLKKKSYLPSWILRPDICKWLPRTGSRICDIFDNLLEIALLVAPWWNSPIGGTKSLSCKAQTLCLRVCVQRLHEGYLDSRKLSDVSHRLNTGESKDSCRLHPGESKWTLVALDEILHLEVLGYFSMCAILQNMQASHQYTLSWGLLDSHRIFHLLLQGNQLCHQLCGMEKGKIFNKSGLAVSWLS